MGKPKNKNNSKNLHLSRTRIKSSRISRAKKTNRMIFHSTKNTILCVIAFAMMIVVLALLFMSFSSPERTVKNKITEIATDYYENYFYAQFTAGVDESLFEENFSRYQDVGFSRVSLRQLLLFDNERYAKSADILSKYCDKNTTYVQFFPYPPFGKTDYKTEFHYSCEF